MEIKHAAVPFEIKNSTEWPNVFSCRFLEDGIVSYKDMENGGIVKLTNETIQKMVASFIGKPVCIDHQKITPQNYEEFRQSGVIVGNVIKVWKNQEDGWWWCDFLVDTEAGRQRIRDFKDKVSCAYMVGDTKEGGLWHDIPYDAEILDGSFTHLALVKNPRYEDAVITEQVPEVLCNGKSAYITKTKEEYMNLKDLLFKKKPDGTKEKLDGVVVINGKDVDLGEFLGTLVEKLNEKTSTEKKTVTLDDVIVHNGKEISVKTLVEMALANEKETAKKKSEESGMKEGEDDNCNAKSKMLAAAKLKNEKDRTPEEKAMIEEEEKEITESKNKKESEVKNAKDKELTEFFNKLNEMANKIPSPEELMGDAPAPRSRTERANSFSDLVKKNMGKK